VFGIGMTELMVIFVIALLVLGPKRLPGLARSLGKGLAEFRRASTDMRREFLDVAEEVRIDPRSLTAEPDAEPTHDAGRDDEAAADRPAGSETDEGDAPAPEAGPGAEPAGKRGDG
jgi:Tat protein translocase TatB subunit